MKTKINTLKYILILPIALFLGGCYTVLWMPQSDTAQLPANEYDGNGYDFYNQDYYGGYWNYYNTPWWVGPVNSYSPNISTPPRTNDVQGLRNNIGGRNDAENSRPGINYGTATRNSNGNETVNKADNSSTSNNNSAQNTQTRSSNNNNSSNNNALRNNNGSRNSDSRRK